MAGRGEDMLLQQIPMPQKHSEEQINRARLVVCEHSHSVDEASAMLAMLGLL